MFMFPSGGTGSLLSDSDEPTADNRKLVHLPTLRTLFITSHQSSFDLTAKYYTGFDDLAITLKHDVLLTGRGKTALLTGRSGQSDAGVAWPASHQDFVYRFIADSACNNGIKG
jgi:hypothetical protein